MVVETCIPSQIQSTLLPPISVKNTIFPPQLSSVGQMLIKSESLEVQDSKVEDVSTTNKMLQPCLETPVKRQYKRKQSSTQESAVTTKVKTSKDNSKTSNNLTEKDTKTETTPKSSKTSEVDLTGRDPDLCPYWIESTTKAISDKLWLPTETVSQGLESNYSNGSLKNILLNSWCSIRQTTTPIAPTISTNYATTYLQSLPSSLPKTTDSEQPQTESKEKQEKPKKKPKKRSKKCNKDIEDFNEELDIKEDKVDKEPPNHVTKIRVYPTTEQKAVLNHWFGCSRYIYNKAVDMNTPFAKKGEYKGLVNNTNYEEDHWLRKVHGDHRENAIRDYIKAVNSTMALLKAGIITKFEMKHRTLKDSQQSLSLRHNRQYKLEQTDEKCGNQRYKAFSFDPSFWKKFKVSPILKTREVLPKNPEYEYRLVKTRLNEYYICIPDRKNTLYSGSDNQTPVEKVCSLDPGCRTFQTIYDPSGNIIEVGRDDMYTKIFPLCKDADRLSSRLKTTHGKKRYKYKQAILRINRRIRRKIDDLHKKLAKFLVLNYNVIFLPSFDTSQMVYKKQRKIGSKVAKSMMTWSHYRFKQSILYKSSQSNHCKVIICSEAYTSKTCGKCGWQHETLGGSKEFKCGNEACKLRIDRDINGARNILLRNIQSALIGRA